MWPFKSNTKSSQPATPEWLKEAKRLEAEALKIETEALGAYRRDQNVSVGKADIYPWLAKACDLRLKALALRLYRGEEQKKDDHQCCGKCDTAKGTAGATATALAAPKIKSRKASKVVITPKQKAAKKTTRSRK